jgi:RHS repeat-associated protein
MFPTSSVVSIVSSDPYAPSKRGSTELSKRTYWRDKRDRIVAWEKGANASANPRETGIGDRYEYDDAGQLTKASYQAQNAHDTATSAERTDDFSYDAMGNREGWNWVASKGMMWMGRRNNGLNQYERWENNLSGPLEHWGVVMWHDDAVTDPPSAPWLPYANGVLMADGWNVAGFNALNQPSSMWSFAYQGTPNWMFFGYDPLGRCVKRWVGSSGLPETANNATFFYYDGSNLIQEGSSATTVDRTYVHGGRVDEIVASAAGAGPWIYHHFDARGHCIMLTNGSGGIVEQYDYDAFGQPYVYNASGALVNRKFGSLAGNRFLFTGREWIKEMRVYDFRARLYQPELGRFLQPDSKQFGAGDYNLYRYCHNDPVNNSDPTGLTEVNLDDFQWRHALFADSASTSQVSMSEMQGTQQFMSAVRDFTHKERQDGSRIDAQTIGKAAVADAKEDAAKVELRDGGRWGIEQATAEYADGANLVKKGPEPGKPYKRDPSAGLPQWGDKVALIGTHAHGPQSGMKGELQKLDEPSANGQFTKGVPYISAVATTVDKGARVQVYVPHYGYFHSTDGVTFSVGK